MKHIIASLLLLSAFQAKAANEVKATKYDSNTMIELTGQAAKQVYLSLKVEEDTSMNDEEGAPLATKSGESLFCSKLTSSKYYCVMYMDPKSGKLSAD